MSPWPTDFDAAMLNVRGSVGLPNGRVAEPQEGPWLALRRARAAGDIGYGSRHRIALGPPAASPGGRGK